MATPSVRRGVAAPAHNEDIRHISQCTSPAAPQSFAVRPDSAPAPDVLSTILRTVHLAGHDVSEYAGDPPATRVQRDDVGAVHIVEGGELQIEVAGTEPHVVGAGDAALLPAGRAHVLRVTGPDTSWITGTFALEAAAGNRLLATLPDVISFEHLRERGYEWFDVSYRLMAKERREPTPGAAVMISRILDLIYIQMLRVWATSTQSSPGWLRAGMDPDIGGVLDAIHADPARDWSYPEMARYAHLSRTAFTERFTRILGQPPMAYLTQLRMELARDLLLGSGETAKQIARRTGYKSDAAFNRAFTRHHGSSPGQWRHDHGSG